MKLGQRVEDYVIISAYRANDGSSGSGYSRVMIRKGRTQ